jgi:ectoine hydroxylase-related dioxygenase (phytanoyl-CoA dioxygenase family)
MYEECNDEIKKYLIKLYPKAGEAIIFDQSIIHYSDANKSGAERIVTNTYFAHQDATFRICYWHPDLGEKVEVFEEDEKFVTDFEQFGLNIHERPRIGTSLGLIDYNFPKLDAKILADRYKPVQTGRFKKILQLFGIN